MYLETSIKEFKLFPTTKQTAAHLGGGGDNTNPVTHKNIILEIPKAAVIVP